MARPTGRHPGRFTTEKVDGVPHRNIPHCPGCDVRLEEIKVPTLNYWQPGFSHIRKYPFTEPTCFCDDCRVKYELPHDNYVLVPMRGDQTLREALCTLLESLQEVSDAHAADDGPDYSVDDGL